MDYGEERKRRRGEKEDGSVYQKTARGIILIHSFSLRKGKGRIRVDSASW